MKHLALALLVGWFMVIKIAQGGVRVGPYADEELCREALTQFLGRMSDAGIKLVYADCVERVEL